MTSSDKIRERLSMSIAMLRAIIDLDIADILRILENKDCKLKEDAQTLWLKTESLKADFRGMLKSISDGFDEDR